jgi:hypothetical protein
MFLPFTLGKSEKSWLVAGGLAGVTFGSNQVKPSQKFLGVIGSHLVKSSHIVFFQKNKFICIFQDQRQVAYNLKNRLRYNNVQFYITGAIKVITQSGASKTVTFSISILQSIDITV